VSRRPGVFTDVAVLAALAWARLGLALRLRKPVNGWRRATGVALRSDASRFGLSVFGLDLWSDSSNESDAQAQFVRRLAAFLPGEAVARVATEPCPHEARAIPHDWADITLARFAAGGGGKLDSIRVFLDERDKLRPDAGLPTASSRHAIDTALVQTYNATRHLPDEERAADLIEALQDHFAGQAAAMRYVTRVLRGSFVSFEEMTEDASSGGAARFVPPDFRMHRHPGTGVLNFVCRLTPDHHAVDVWLQIHHAAADGVPMQEMLTRLEKAWGVSGGASGEMTYPTAAEFEPLAVAKECSTEGHAAPRRIELVTAFLDFSPLLAWRKELLARVGPRVAGEIPVTALLLWLIAGEAELTGTRFGPVAEIPAGETCGREPCFLSIRPADFGVAGWSGATEGATALDGLVAYVQAFNEQLQATRQRRSEIYKGLNTLALLPPGLQRKVLKRHPDRTRATFGTVGLSIIKDAKIFIAPMSDIGFDDGFIAVGSVNLPTAAGGRVGCVSIKGPTGTTMRLLGALRRGLRGLPAANVVETPVPETAAAG